MTETIRREPCPDVHRVVNGACENCGTSFPGALLDEDVEVFLRTFYREDRKLGHQGWDDFNPHNKLRIRALARDGLSAFLTHRGRRGVA